MAKPRKTTYTCTSCQLRFLATEQSLGTKQRTATGVICLLCIGLSTEILMSKKVKKGPARKESKKAKKQVVAKAATKRTMFKRGGDDLYIPPTGGGEW